MIIDLVDKLIDRLIQLVKHKQELSRNLFTNFIEPIYLQFEAIHQQYLISFKGYRDFLKETNTSIESLVDKIKEDKLFNEGKRRKIYASSKFSDNLSRGSNDQLVDSFILQIQKYLNNPYDFTDDPNLHKCKDELVVGPYEFIDNPNAHKPVEGAQRWYSTFVETLERYNRSKDQVKKDIERMSWNNEERLKSWLLDFCRDERYKNVLPTKLKEYIRNVKNDEELEDKIKLIKLNYVKNLLTEIEYRTSPSLESQKKNAIEALDSMVEQMQDLYGEVSAKYFQLRKELLTKYE